MSFKIIIAAVDFSPASRAVVTQAVALADAMRAQVHLMHALTLSELSESSLRSGTTLHDAQGAAERELRKLAEPHLDSGRIASSVVREGDPASVVVKVAEELHADLIVVDSHHRGLRRLAYGSVAESLVRSAHCAVLVLRSQT
jgi:nucleotide-binding universal stress UspA family protein